MSESARDKAVAWITEWIDHHPECTIPDEALDDLVTSTEQLLASALRERDEAIRLLKRMIMTNSHEEAEAWRKRALSAESTLQDYVYKLGQALEALEGTAGVDCYATIRIKLRCFPHDLCSSCRARKALAAIRGTEVKT